VPDLTVVCVADDVIVGAELSDVSLVDFDRHLIGDFAPGRYYCCCC